MKLLSAQPRGVCFYRHLFLKALFLQLSLPGILMASEQQQEPVENTLPFLIMVEDHSTVPSSESSSVLNFREEVSLEFPEQTLEGPVTSGARLKPSIEDIPMQAFADLQAKIEEAFELMGDASDSNYQLESIELHVTTSAEGRLLIASAGIEGGMKLVFKRR
ncbi:MAG: Pepco domain-containing protein [Pseudomonadota bacterium]